MKEILLGFECGTGKPIKIAPNHLVVTGITDESGKTTTLEALIVRSGLTAIVFKTKPGEKGFGQGTEIPPFFKERSDWEYVESLFEAAMKEKMRFERAWIINACKGTTDLLAVANKVKEARATGIMDGKKLNSLSLSVYTTLDAYFAKIMPQLQATRFSNTLDLQEGLNLMNLERFSFEVQSLVINSVMEEVLHKNKNVIVVAPEAWKFMPEGRNTPCKLSGEELIRQGATNRNLLWADSQDITGMEKTILKQVSTWILGKQNEINEIKRTLDQVPLRIKPKPQEIALLKRGQFFVVTSQFTKKVYVWPIWLDEKTAIEIAKGKKDVESVKHPDKIAPFSIQPMVKPMVQQGGLEAQKVYAKLQQEMVELRQDFFNKIQEQHDYIQRLYEQLSQIQSQQLSEDVIVSKVLQKIPAPSITSSMNASMNVNDIVAKILPLIPKGGSTVYEVAPLEKIKKDFLEEIKNKILSDVSKLNEEQKKILKFIETQNKGVNQTNILEKCLFISATSGGSRTRVSQECKEMANLFLVRMDKNAVCYASLKERIKELMGTHEATEQEQQQLFNHILADVLK